MPQSANEARRSAVAGCGLMKGTGGCEARGVVGSVSVTCDMPATASRRRSARHKPQGAGGLAIEHHRPLPGLHAGLRVCPCEVGAWLRCRRSRRLFGIVAVVVVVAVFLIAVGCCWLLVTPPPHLRLNLRHTCATPAPHLRHTSCAAPCAKGAQPLRHPCATPAPPLRLTFRRTLRHPCFFDADPPLAWAGGLWGILYPPPACGSLTDGRPVLFWVLVLMGACQSGTVWSGLCLIHHHQRVSGQNDGRSDASTVFPETPQNPHPPPCARWPGTFGS